MRSNISADLLTDPFSQPFLVVERGCVKISSKINVDLLTHPFTHILTNVNPVHLVMTTSDMIDYNCVNSEGCCVVDGCPEWKANLS